MGAGNWLPGNRYELLDWQGFYVDYEGIYGERYFEDDLYDAGEMDMFIETVVDQLLERFPDLSRVSKWRGRDEHIYLEDEIIKLVMGENESSVAVYFILEDSYYDDESTEYVERYGEKFGEYVEGLKEILIEHYPGYVYERTGPWTNPKIG